MVILRVIKIWDFIRYLEDIFLKKITKWEFKLNPTPPFLGLILKVTEKKKLLQHDLCGGKY